MPQAIHEFQIPCRAAAVFALCLLAGAGSLRAAPIASTAAKPGRISQSSEVAPGARRRLPAAHGLRSLQCRRRWPGRYRHSPRTKSSAAHLVRLAARAAGTRRQPHYQFRGCCAYAARSDGTPSAGRIGSSGSARDRPMSPSAMRSPQFSIARSFAVQTAR